ncbi:MAG: GDSL-type esterase/lipase family protein [Actinomycetota bacterium]
MDATMPIDLSAPGCPVEVRGIAELTGSPGALRPMRLPAWALAQTDTPALPVVASMPSGARLSFLTDATEVVIEAQLITTKTADRPVMPVVFEATADGEPVARAAATDYHLIHTPDVTKQDVVIVPGRPARVVLDGLPTGRKHLEVWLPQNAGIEIRTFAVSAGAAVLPPPVDTRRRWVHYGSSISHCMEAGHPLGVWPVIAARAAGVDVRNLGLGGQCHLDQFVARMIRDSDADMVSMKVGINVVNLDSMRDRAFLPAFHGFVDTVREGKPGVPLLVVSPIFCPGHEDGPGPSLRSESGVYSRERPGFLATGALTLRRIRELLATAVAARRDAGDTDIHYLDGLSLFGEGDAADLPDLLHPNSEGYARMGARFHRLAFVDGPFAGPAAGHQSAPG